MCFRNFFVFALFSVKYLDALIKADCAERVHGAIIAVDVAVRLLSSLIVLSHMGSFTGCLGTMLILEDVLDGVCGANHNSLL